MLVTRIVGIPGKERRAPSGPASRGKSQSGNTENAPSLLLGAIVLIGMKYEL